jgi:predicted lipase
VSDISNVLRKVIELDISLGLDGTQEALDEIARLTAEVERLRSLTVVQESLIRKAETENEKLRAALRVCEAELNTYYRMEYPSDHPYSQKKLAQAMASNPATVALKENNNDQG